MTSLLKVNIESLYYIHIHVEGSRVVAPNCVLACSLVSNMYVHSNVFHLYLSKMFAPKAFNGVSIHPHMSSKQILMTTIN